MELFEEQEISNKVRFLEIYQKWFEIYKLTVKESTSAKTKERFKLHILPDFQYSKIEDITYDDVQSFALKLSKKIKSYKIIITYLSQVFNHAIRLGIIKSNPCDLIIYPKTIEEKKEIPIWTVEDIKTFLIHAKKDMPFKYYVYFYLIITTGARRGEILALNWNDIQGDKISINKTITRGESGYIIDSPKTEKSTRILIINNEAIKLLKELRIQTIKRLGVQEKVFTNLDSNYISLTTPIKYLQKVIKDHNLPYMTIHGLRHTLTSLMDKEGIKPVTMSQILGHTNQKMTNHYTHSYEEEQRKAIQNMSELLG